MEQSSETSAAGSPAALGGGMSGGIDWSIFKDSEEDAFGWLLRTPASAPSLAQLQEDDDEDGMDVSAAVPALPLDDIHMDDETMLVGLGHAAPATATSAQIKQESSRGAGSQRLTANALAAHLFSSAGAQRKDSRYRVPKASRGKSADGSYAEEDDEDDDETGYNSGDDQSVTYSLAPSELGASSSAPGAAKGKRALKRKKSVASSEHDGEDEQDKKQLRRVKNLASVREFRKRKMKQMEQNEHRLRRLEAENLDLKMRLKIGKEAIVSEQREKQQIKEQMREMLQHNASEQEIARFLNMYKVTYSDYGPKRREKLRFHLERIRELLLPTQVTKLCLYSVEQGVDMIARDHVIKEDPMSMPDSSAAPMSLWGILATELDVSEAQQRQILERRTSIKKVQDDLNHTLHILKQLEEVTDEKNTALESQVAQLQQILTPSQATKFIIWVKENPAFMYMLDKLVDKTLRNTEGEDE
ncbi:Camp responsive element modulator [Globisporangium polare]